MRPITPYCHALSYLCEYLMELLVLSSSIWFLFYPYTFYSCILLRVHSIHTSFVWPLLNLLQSTKIRVNHLVRTKGLRISETKHDQSNPIKILEKSSVHVNVSVILNVD